MSPDSLKEWQDVVVAEAIRRAEARVMIHRKVGWPAPPPPPPSFVPAKPTDAEIVDVMESWQRHETPLVYTNCVATFAVAGYARPVTMAEARAAWSRELKRRVAESKAKERNRIVCEGTLPEDY